MVENIQMRRGVLALIKIAQGLSVQVCINVSFEIADTAIKIGKHRKADNPFGVMFSKYISLFLVEKRLSHKNSS